MKISRREVTKILLAAAVAPPGLAVGAASRAPGAKTWDVAIIGAGVFGAWSAYWLREAGLHVILLDAYGAANSRSSSGGESRIIRAAYGEDDFYSRWALRSLPQWKELAARSGQEIFNETGGNEMISAGVFVFACGPWLPKVFPQLLGSYIQPERAEVYFLGVGPGD